MRFCIKTILSALFVSALFPPVDMASFALEPEPYTDKIRTYVGTHSEADIRFFTGEANLIFDGKCSAVAQLSELKEVFIDARAQHGIQYRHWNEMAADLPWLVTFKIDKVLKGVLPKDKNVYNLLVHSPGTTFGIAVDKDRNGSDNRYRIYVKLRPEQAQGELEENILLAALAV